MEVMLTPGSTGGMGQEETTERESTEGQGGYSSSLRPPKFNRGCDEASKGSENEKGKPEKLGTMENKGRVSCRSGYKL